MPANPEAKPEQVPYQDLETDWVTDHPLFKQSPVAWFEQMVQEVEANWQKVQANPARYNMENVSTAEFEARKQKHIREVGLAIHEMVETWVQIWFETRSLGSGHKSNPWSYLGQFRQTLIQHGVRPELHCSFNFSEDLSKDGVRLYKLLRQGLGDREDLLILARDERRGFDFEAAVEELRRWGLLDKKKQQWLELRELPETQAGI